MTFAVIKTGGKQYKVAANDVLKIEKLEATTGDIVTFDQVLMIGDESGTTLGAPLVEGALVAAEFIDTKKQKTVIIFKKNRRHNYRRRNGHRQLLSTVRITEILTGGAQPSLAARTRRAPAVSEAAPAANDAPVNENDAPGAEALVAEAKPKRAPRKVAAETAATSTEESTTPARKSARKAAPEAEQE